MFRCSHTGSLARRTLFSASKTVKRLCKANTLFSLHNCLEFIRSSRWSKFLFCGKVVHSVLVCLCDRKVLLSVEASSSTERTLFFYITLSFSSVSRHCSLIFGSKLEESEAKTLKWFLKHKISSKVSPMITVRDKEDRTEMDNWHGNLLFPARICYKVLS